MCDVPGVENERGLLREAVHQIDRPAERRTDIRVRLALRRELSESSSDMSGSFVVNEGEDCRPGVLFQSAGARLLVGYLGVSPAPVSRSSRVRPCSSSQPVSDTAQYCRSLSFQQAM